MSDPPVSIIHAEVSQYTPEQKILILVVDQRGLERLEAEIRAAKAHGFPTSPYIRMPILCTSSGVTTEARHEPD